MGGVGQEGSLTFSSILRVIKGAAGARQERAAFVGLPVVFPSTEQKLHSEDSVLKKTILFFLLFPQNHTEVLCDVAPSSRNVNHRGLESLTATAVCLVQYYHTQGVQPYGTRYRSALFTRHLLQ